MMLRSRMLLLVLLALVCGWGSADERPKLVLLTWNNYLDPVLAEEFEQRYQVELVEDHFDSDQARTDALESSGAEGVDIILVAGSDIRRYAQHGWLAPLQVELIPNLDRVDPSWRNAFAGSFRYAVPYFQGVTGIVYRSDLIKEPINSWMQLFRPRPELQGKIIMTDDASELVQAGLKALGYSLNSVAPDQLRQTKQLLLEQQPHVLSYSYLSLSKDSPLMRGDAVAAFTYSDHVSKLQQQNPAIRFVVPEEGSNLWGDYLAVSARSQQPELAHSFLDFISDPGNASRNAQYMYGASSNSSTTSTPQPGQEQVITFDPIELTPEELERSEFSRMMTDDIEQQRYQIGIELMAPVSDEEKLTE